MLFKSDSFYSTTVWVRSQRLLILSFGSSVCHMTSLSKHQKGNEGGRDYRRETKVGEERKRGRKRGGKSEMRGGKPRD